MCLFNFAMNACIDYPEQRGGRHDPKIPLANPNKAAMPYINQTELASTISDILSG